MNKKTVHKAGLKVGACYANELEGFIEGAKWAAKYLKKNKRGHYLDEGSHTIYPCVNVIDITELISGLESLSFYKLK